MITGRDIRRELWDAKLYLEASQLQNFADWVVEVRVRRIANVQSRGSQSSAKIRAIEESSGARRSSFVSLVIAFVISLSFLLDCRNSSLETRMWLSPAFNSQLISKGPNYQREFDAHHWRMRIT